MKIFGMKNKTVKTIEIKNKGGKNKTIEEKLKFITPSMKYAKSYKDLINDGTKEKNLIERTENRFKVYNVSNL